VLINNSGIVWGGPFENFPEEKGWDNVFAVNVKSVFYSAFSSSVIPSFSQLGHHSDRWVSLQLKNYSIHALTLAISLTDLLTKDANNLDPGRVINISSVSSFETNVESSLSLEGQGTWSCKDYLLV
jgi:NAD(P)-dependent dehydrogenase (short-subunit alcohol dehydrogenase family)